MQKKWISVSVITLLLSFESLGQTLPNGAGLDCTQVVAAPYTATYATMDVGRMLNGITVGVINLVKDGESKAQLIAEQEENKQ